MANIQARRAYPTVPEFKELLLTQPLEEIAKSQVFARMPYAFSMQPAAMGLLRKHLSGPLGIAPDDIVIIGSAQIGFSLSPDNFPRAFTKDSDIDVLLVDAKLFDAIWNTLLAWHYWAENRIITAASIRRMGDIEFVSELLIGAMHGPQGGSASVIDEYYRQYEDYEDEFPDQRRAQKVFDENLRAIQQILPNIKDSRWSNKTDFYSLFVALAFVQRPLEVGSTTAKHIRRALEKLETEVDRRLADENARVSKEAVVYVRAVEKGANDKQRRAARHAALVTVLGGHLKFKTV